MGPVPAFQYASTMEDSVAKSDDTPEQEAQTPANEGRETQAPQGASSCATATGAGSDR